MRKFLFLFLQTISFHLAFSQDIIPPPMESGFISVGKVGYRLTLPQEYGTIDSFVEKTLVYPKDAIKDKLKGKVMVSFELDKEGKIIDFSLVEEVNPLFEKEVRRIIPLLPTWKPHADFGQYITSGYGLAMFTFWFNPPQ
jgi:Gram-negative bacterial TonB protein C-terminal